MPGGLNTDIIGLGVEKLLSPGELTLGGEFKIGPGGKARNMAQMAAAYLGKNKVAMIGRTCKDPIGLWNIPIHALQDAGVDTTHIKISSFEEAHRKYPGIAIIPVDKEGQNQIYVLPGVNKDFSIKDIDNSKDLFKNENHKKVMILALEIPMETAKYCIDKAFEKKIKVILDPGGISTPIDDILDKKIYFLKPNEHEAKILTGYPVRDFISAEKAARVLLSKGVKNVLITHGKKGAYYFNNLINLHIPCPEVQNSKTNDETGCGDQVTSMVASCLAEGKDISESVKIAVFAGTIQYHREGIKPVSKKELLASKEMK